MHRKLSILAVFILVVTVLTLGACGSLVGTPPAPSVGVFLPMATRANEPCVVCAQATALAAQIQFQNNLDNQAAATAEVMRAHALETLNSANATLGAAQTQQQENANFIAAQIEATAQIIRANAQATLVAAGSTQGAALTQDAIRQTQAQNSLQAAADLVTQNAIATVTQQKTNLLAGSTQTAAADTIATQTQSAVATTQWYTDLARKRDAQRQVPLTFLWLVCPPLFIVAITLISLLYFWRWMKIREARLLNNMQLEEPLIIEHEPLPISPPANKQFAPIKPVDHVDRWLDEVKHKLETDKKDDDDNPGS